MEVLEEQQKIDQNSQPTDDEDAVLKTQLNTESKQIDDEKQSITVPQLDMEQLSKQTPQQEEIDKSLGKELLSPTQQPQVTEEALQSSIPIEQDQKELPVSVNPEEVQQNEAPQEENLDPLNNGEQPQEEQQQQEIIIPESMKTFQQYYQASNLQHIDTPRGSQPQVAVESQSGSLDQLNEEMMQRIKKLQDQKLNGSQKTLVVGEEMETIILEEQTNQDKEEKANVATDRVQNNNFDESEIHPNPKETNVQSEVREALNKSEIGEIFDTLQEFKQPNEDIIIDKEVIRNIIEMNKQLIREKEEMFEILQMKEKEIQALQAQLESQKNQRNVDNSTLFQDVSGINHKSVQENNKDLTLYEVLNQSNTNQRNFNQSWVLNVEKIMSQNEAYAPLIKQKKKPTPMDYLSRKPFSIGKLPSLRQKQNRSLEKSADKSKEYQKVPFSEKFKQSASNVLLKNAKNTEHTSTHDPRMRISSNKETKMNGYKYTHGASFTDEEAEQEVDKIFQQEQQQQQLETEEDEQRVECNQEEYIKTTEESPKIERRPSYEDNQGYGIQYAPEAEPFNFTLKPNPEPKKKVTLVAPSYPQAPEPEPITRSLHTFKDSPFPLLSQKQSYYNRAVQKQLINMHQNRIVHPIQNSSSLLNFKGTSTRDTNFRQTPGFNLK